MRQHREDVRFCGRGRLERASDGLVLIGVSCFLAYCSGAVWGVHAHVPFSEVAHGADVIFVGTVVDASARWGPMGRMIFTDVTFAEITRVRQKGGAVSGEGDSVMLAFAGGQVGDRGVRVSGVPEFEVGRRYVVFALADGRPYANPVMGGEQGLFRVEQDAVTGWEFPVTPGGAGIAAVGRDRLRLTRKLERIEWGVPIEVPARHVEMVAPRSAKGSSEPAWSRQVVPAAEVLTLEEFLDEVDAILAEGAPLDVASVPLPSGGGAEGDVRVAGASGNNVEPMAGTPLCYCGNWELPLTMEQVPSEWTSYTENGYAMWLWNRFMNIYEVTPADGAVGHNGDSEFAGWMGNADMNTIYGTMWGANELGMCFTWWYGEACAVHGLDEADIVFNANATWRYDFDETFDVGGVVLYRPLVMHELGHTWGFVRGDCVEDYSYDLPSVMHSYYSYVVEDGFGIHAADAWGIRNAYDSETTIRTILDLGVESYHADSGLVNSTTDKTDYDVGESITIENYTIENMSNTAVSDVRIRFFLSVDQTITTTDYQMGDYWEWASLAKEATWVGSTTTTIPVVPTGTYWVGAIVTRNGAWYNLDDYAPNNYTFWPIPIDVTCFGAGTPFGVSATDGTECGFVRITWNPALHAEEYRVYRNGTPIGSWQTERSYDDAGPDAWEVCSYQVRSRNQCGEGGLSYANDGHPSGVPTTPTNVQASDGTSCDYVYVSWTAVRSADYIVIRDDMAISGWQEDNRYYDYSGEPGQVYTYYVKSRNGCGQSIHSTGNEGHRIGPPAAPDDVQATDGDFCDRVRVFWDAVTGATEYRVHRDGLVLSEWLVGNSFDDTTVGSGQLHSYQVQARGVCAEGETGDADYGYRIDLRGPVASDPLNGAAGVGVATALQWNRGPYVATAGLQQLHRLDLSNGKAELIGGTGVYPGGMAWTGMVMYVISLDGRLYTLDLSSGAATMVGDTGIYGWQGLAADPYDGGQLYGVVQNGDLRRVSSDGTTSVVATGIDYLFTGLTFDGDGVLWGIEFLHGDIYTIDKTNGALTLTASMGLGGFDGIDFDADGVLWAQNSILYAGLYVIDLASGRVTMAGPTGAPHIKGLAFDNYPGADVAGEMGGAAASTLDVAVVGADSGGRLRDIQTKLLGTGQFASVSIIDTRYQTPTFWELQAFEAVQVHANYQHLDQEAMGDVMADYVDFGGRVVCAYSETGGSATYRMAGRWATGDYLLIPPDEGSIAGAATLGTVHEPTHPIMAGVTTFDGGSGSFRPETMDVYSGVVRIADWSDGRPLVAVRHRANGVPRVDLGLYPPSSDVSVNCWDSATDGALLMANALTWVARGGCANVYDVYFGTKEPLPLVATEQTERSWSPGDELIEDTTYLWQVVTKNCCGEAAGEIWSFRTEICELPGDADHDGEVRLDDFDRLARHLGRCALGWEEGDFSGDGCVGLDDLGILVSRWLDSCPHSWP